MNPASSHQSNLSLPVELRTMLYLLREKWWLIALVIVAALALGFTFLARTPKVFAATTTVQVEQEQDKLPGNDERHVDGRTAEETLQTIEENFKSPALMLRLAQSPELARNPDFLRGLSRPISDAKLQSILATKISAKIRRGTRLIDITAEDESPEIAQKLANLVVQEFIRGASESRAAVTRGAHEFLRAEADRLKATLTASEQALQRYREQHQSVSLDEKQNTVVERLKDLNTKVLTARADRLKLESDHAQLQRLESATPEQLLALPSIANAAEVIDLRRRLGDKDTEIAAMKLRYRSEHPRYIQAAAEQGELSAALDAAIIAAREQILIAAEAARATEEKLEEALLAQEHLALELGRIAVPYQALTREVESDRALYDSLLTRLKRTDVARDVSPFAIRVEAPALLPERPIRPDKRLVLILSLGAGAAVALTLVLGTHVLDSSVKTVDDAESTLGLKVVGAIPKRRGTSLGDTRKLLQGRPSALGESFRALRAELIVSDQTRNCRSVLFASAIPSEGKSFCAINFAAALAQQGVRTLLIDADLRLASTSQVFFADARMVGVTDVLRGNCELSEALQVTTVQNLSVLPAGARVGTPAELIARASFPDLLSAALARFDRVVIDTAPVHAVSETILLAPHADAVCLVVRAGKTPATVAARALQKLRDSGAKVVGLVLNGLPARGGYYYHFQSPGYGRDEVYGERTAARA